MRLSLLSLLAIGGMSLAASAGQAPEITLIPAPALNWVETPEGVAFAALEGDRLAGPYRAMVRLPAGIASPLHVKSANMFGVMVAGEMIHITKGQDADTARRLGPGSYYMVPKGLPHISACVSEVPCVAYLFQDGAFDFLPVAQ